MAGINAKILGWRMPNQLENTVLVKDRSNIYIGMRSFQQGCIHFTETHHAIIVRLKLFSIL